MRSLLAIALLFALLADSVWAKPVVINLETEPAGAEVYLLTTSSREKGLFLGKSDGPLAFEERYLKGRGSLDLRIEKDGYHPVSYNLKVLAIQEGATLPRDGPVHLPAEEVGSFALMAGLGLIASLGIAAIYALPKAKPVETPDEGSNPSLSIDPFIKLEVCGYRIQKLVAKGGMGSLYYALSAGCPQNEAAIKIIDLHGRSETLRERFFRELAVASKLHHPAIVQTWDYEVLEERFLAIAMEWLPGRPLSRHMGENLTPQESLDLLTPVFEGLQFLHDRGITHRDIKPGNILISPERVAKIIDFGLAKDEGQEAITQTGMMVGTPKYMAPEQIKGKGQASVGVDQYALGLIIYELVTGRAPFETSDPMMLIFHHLEEDPTLACEVNPEVTLAFASALSRMIDRDSEKRYASVTEALKALRRVA